MASREGVATVAADRRLGASRALVDPGVQAQSEDTGTSVRERYVSCGERRGDRLALSVGEAGCVWTRWRRRRRRGHGCSDGLLHFVASSMTRLKYGRSDAFVTSTHRLTAPASALSGAYITAFTHDNQRTYVSYSTR